MEKYIEKFKETLQGIIVIDVLQGIQNNYEIKYCEQDKMLCWKDMIIKFTDSTFCLTIYNSKNAWDIYWEFRNEIELSDVNLNKYKSSVLISKSGSERQIDINNIKYEDIDIVINVIMKSSDFI